MKGKQQQQQKKKKSKKEERREGRKERTGHKRDGKECGDDTTKLRWVNSCRRERELGPYS